MDGGRTQTEAQDQADNANIAPALEQFQPAAANQFGAVRDRLYHAMLVRIALSYSRHFSSSCRRIIEFGILLIALTLLWLLFYVHIFGKSDSSCLSHLIDSWPRDGVLRVEVVSNLESFIEYQNESSGKYRQSNGNQTATTYFNLKDVFVEGPRALPKEFKTHGHAQRSSNDFKKRNPLEDSSYDEYADYQDDFLNESPSESIFEYVMEYSLHYGLLRLSHSYRTEHNIPFMLVRLDPEVDKCFGSRFSRALMKYFIGYEDVLMASVKMLAENETEKGYLRDMITGDHYRFVTMVGGNASFLTALLVMLIFTFAVSMLLRFSHHQIFLFIVDVLQMFELNHTLIFPAAPLLTVILALVGMEAIMSEIFNDTSTAFYVILLVWIADQYDAICCISPISKRFWLRFFFFYHYAFYAYHYRYNGQYNGLALITSFFFILHSMIFFFHHYEMPLLLYMERVRQLLDDFQRNPTQRAADSNTPNDIPEVVRDGEVPQLTNQNDMEMVYSGASNGYLASRIGSSSNSRGVDQIDNGRSNLDMPSTSSAPYASSTSYAAVSDTHMPHSSQIFGNQSQDGNSVGDVPLAVDRTAQEIVDVALNEAYRS